MRRWRTPYIRWHHDRAPDPPESISKYLADGLPKQDTKTLEDVRDYVDKLVKHRRRPVNETDLPDDAEPVDEDDSKRTTLVKRGREVWR